MAKAATFTDDTPPSAATGHDGGDVARAQGIEASGNAVSGRSVTINKPVAEVFSRFRDFARLPSFMENLERVDVIDATRSHWVVKAPVGKTVEFDSIITEERENALIAWTSADGASVPNSGRIDFRDAGARGTVVTATIVYDPPAGVVGKLVAKMFQREPAIQARRDLRRFKQLMETGEIATPAMNRRQFEEMGL